MSCALHAAGKFFIRKKAEFPQQYKETIERACLFQSIAGKRLFRYSCGAGHHL